MKNIILIFSVALLLFSCAKEEGVGGKNTLQGVVMMQERHKISDILIAQYPAPEERIYIIYGEDTYYSDEIRSNYDGSFRFEFLYSGAYTVFAYSECKNCDAETEPIFAPIEIDSRKEDIILDTIFIINYVN